MRTILSCKMCKVRLFWAEYLHIGRCSWSVLLLLIQEITAKSTTTTMINSKTFFHCQQNKENLSMKIVIYWVLKIDIKFHEVVRFLASAQRSLWSTTRCLFILSPNSRHVCHITNLKYVCVTHCIVTFIMVNTIFQLALKLLLQMLV